MTRFSPTSGTTSASVPMAAILMKPGSQLVCARLAAERLHELQRDADAGQVLVRIASSRARFGLMTASAGGSSASGSWWSVMIRSTPSSRGATRGVRAADAAVDRDDQRDAVGVQPLDGRRLQAVAVLEPLGDEVHDVGAEQLERPPQDDGRGHAVHVVVAVDGDPLPARDRRQDPVDRQPHVGERHRIVQMVESTGSGSGAPARDRPGHAGTAGARRPRHAQRRRQALGDGDSSHV